MKESNLNHWNESFLKQIPVWCQHETLAYCRPLVGLLALAWILIHSLPLGGVFRALQICFPSNAVHKAALRSMKSTNHSRLASCKGGVWKKLSFGSRWANKVKIMHIIRQQKCCMNASLLFGTPETPKINLSLPITGAL